MANPDASAKVRYVSRVPVLFLWASIASRNLTRSIEVCIDNTIFLGHDDPGDDDRSFVRRTERPR